MIGNIGRTLLVGVVALGGGAGIGTLAVEPEVAPETSVAEQAHLEVSLGERRLVVKQGSEVIGEYSVAIGTSDHPTPTGSFQIRRIIWNPSWTPPDAEWARDEKPTPPGDPKNPMGRVKIFFAEPDYYIHGTSDEQSIGRAASHGCLRMRNGEIIELARLVMEHGGERREPNWFRRIINRVTDTQDVRLSQPVRIQITA